MSTSSNNNGQLQRGAKFDTEIYDVEDADQYSSEIVDAEEEALNAQRDKQRREGSNADIVARSRNEALASSSSSVDEFDAHRRRRVSDKENEYQQRGRLLSATLSPTRRNAYEETPAHPSASSSSSSSSSEDVRSYVDVMAANRAEQDHQAVMRAIEKKRKDELLIAQARALAAKHQSSSAEGQSGAGAGAGAVAAVSDGKDAAVSKRRRRWDEGAGGAAAGEAAKKENDTDWGATPVQQEKPDTDWDQTPSHRPSSSSSRWENTPSMSSATPVASSSDTPSGSKKRSRWDQTPTAATPIASSSSSSSLPMVTPAASSHGIMQTPLTVVANTNAALMTPSRVDFSTMTPEQIAAYRAQLELDARNRPWTEEALNKLLPETGYVIMPAPASYVPIVTPGRKLMATPTPMSEGVDGIYQMPDRQTFTDAEIPATPSESGLPAFNKPEDATFFAKLLDDVSEEELSVAEQKERRIMKLLLKVKNGDPPQRKSALRQLTEKAKEFGPGPLFDQILPLLMSPTLEDQERHLLVKVIDRILYKLDDLVRPYVHKILVVIEPLLIDEDYYARVEGREIISNVAKAAGLGTMIATMRPDIDNPDEYVRNTTARAFAVVASALGIHALLPFLKAVCLAKKAWEARHTGIKIVQQIAILMGCAVLPHLKTLVEIIENGLSDEQSKVRCICGLALAALAEAASPYGIESFDPVLRPLLIGAKQHRGKTLAAFLKAIGYIIPLMEAEHASYYTKNVMPIVIREFATPDEEMKKIVLKVVKQCVGTEGVDIAYVRDAVLPDYFRHFWTRRLALDKRNYKQVVETTVEIAVKVGGALVMDKIVGDLKDESEPYRRMVMEAIEQIMAKLGAADIDNRLEELLMDGLIYAFQEQQGEETRAMLSGFGVVVNALGLRAKAYLPQICGIIKWRLNNKSARVRGQSADLIARIAVVMKSCGEDQLLSHMGQVLYEYLGEEYPEVLASILGAIKAVVNVVGMENMKPPIKDLLPRLTPILRNRHEKVQENVIDLVGRIADRGAEYVPPKEWMRISFDLLEMLNAHKRAIKRATVNTFGYIAKAIGPSDVLVTLLNNLKVQERSNRVCTTVAIAIVAETCAPFTVLPALLNEYRVPELNVQNGVLKALSFLFEYIGEMGKDYVYAVCSLLEDALQDRDMVHRQIAANVVKHMSLGVIGLDREDAMQHLLNHIWPNIFETSPHVIGGVLEAIEGMGKALGPTKVLQYTLQGLFHPARKVRAIYWKIYNSLYTQAQDSLVPAFPKIEDDKKNTYTRHHLEMFI